MKGQAVSFLLLFISTIVYGQRIDHNTVVTSLPHNSYIGSDWELDFSDEFEDQSLNTSKWSKQDEYRGKMPSLSIDDYWWKPQNVSLSSGSLVLDVEKHDDNTMYCGSVNSKIHYETTYGYYEARIKIAEVQTGTSTAFWLYSDSILNINGHGVDGAEIDILESPWVDNSCKSAIHIDGYSDSHKANTSNYKTINIHDGNYHIWGFHWTPDFMRIYYDGELVNSFISPLWIPKNDEFIWFSNEASFGFNYGSNNFVNQTIGSITQTYVDYIRVWKEPYPSSTSKCNLISNGQFENESYEDFAWTPSDNFINLKEASFPVYEKSNYCRLVSSDSKKYIYQDVLVTPGETYEFSLNGRIHNSYGESGSQSNIVAWFGPGTLTGQILDRDTVLLEISTKSNINTAIKGTVTIPYNVNMVRVMISKNWNQAYIDNVVLKSLSNSDCGALEFKSFDCYANMEEILLNWDIGSNADYINLELQKSYDRSDWEAVDCFNMLSFNNNTYIDKYPLKGKNYYRFKQVSIDGTYVYSNIVSSDYKGVNKSKKIFYNPSNGSISISGLEKEFSIVLLSITGEIYKKIECKKSTLNLDMSEFSKGIYYLSFLDKGNNLSSVQKIVKV